MEQKNITITVHSQESRLAQLRERKRRNRMRLLALAMIAAAGAVVGLSISCVTAALDSVQSALDQEPAGPVVLTVDKLAAPDSEAGVEEVPAITVTEEERELMAQIVYLEARGEPFEGQQAVAEVILNRVESEDFPGTVEEVICQTDPLQFASSPLLDMAEPGAEQYAAVDAALYGYRVLPKDVVFFDTRPLTDNVWGKIGNHWFCMREA